MIFPQCRVSTEPQSLTTDNRWALGRNWLISDAGPYTPVSERFSLCLPAAGAGLSYGWTITSATLSNQGIGSGPLPWAARNAVLAQINP